MFEKLKKDFKMWWFLRRREVNLVAIGLTLFLGLGMMIGFLFASTVKVEQVVPQPTPPTAPSIVEQRELGLLKTILEVEQDQAESEVLSTLPQSFEQVDRDVRTVAAGDTLWSIAVREYDCGYDYTNLLTANNLEEKDLLLVDQQLVIPEVEVSNCDQVTTGFIDTSVFTQSYQSELSQQDQNDENQINEVGQISILSETQEYLVKPGDSLWSIAEQELDDPYRWVEIYENNQQTIGDDPNMIHVGLELQI